MHHPTERCRSLANFSKPWSCAALSRMLKISILMYDPILHSDTGVNSKVPLAYLPLKEEDCARARLTRCAGALVSWTALSLLSLKDSLAEGAGEKRQIEKSGKGIVPGKNGRLQRPSQ